MDSSRKSKRSSAATYSVSSKGPGKLILLCLAAVLGTMLFPALARAEGGVVSATGNGRDTAEAITSLLRNTLARYFKEQPQFTRNILQTEILPNASSFVQSYKLNEGSHAGALSLSANIDLDVIQGLLSLTPANLGEEGEAKALVVVHGAKLPDAVAAAVKAKNTPDPYAPLAEAARERFGRRGFGDAQISSEEQQAVLAGEDVANPEALRGVGAKSGARLVLAITSRYETYENENAHNKEERIVLSASLVDVKTGAQLARSSVNVMSPKSRRDQYAVDLQRNLIDESKDLFQGIFVAAGRKLRRVEAHDDFAVVRVLFPPNPTLLYRFKALLEATPGVRSVLEYSVRRGQFDFAVRPVPTDSAAFSKAMAAIQAPDLYVTVTPGGAAAQGDAEGHSPLAQVRLEPKDSGALGGSVEGGADAGQSVHH